MHSRILPSLVAAAELCAAKQWPYDRYRGIATKNGRFVPDTAVPGFRDEHPLNEYGQWLHRIVNRPDNDLQRLFVNESVPDHASLDDIWKNFSPPDPTKVNKNKTTPPHLVSRPWSSEEASKLFSHLPFDLDPRCISDRNKWWYRTYDGSCNWIKKGEINEGQYGMAKSRDYGQYSYEDGISEPRNGPNPRAVSNAFFKRKETLYYEHTPLLLGLVEFIMHDITWSQDSITEYVDVPMPDDEEVFDKNVTLRVYRTEAVPGTGTSQENPRENINRATTWLDLSSLYGSTDEVAKKLRSFNKGKLLTQEIKTRGTKKAASYLPFNSMEVPTRTRPGVKTESLFAGGDPRTNEDWVMLGVHTLFLREHNRMCDLLAERHPEYNDEELYQTVRLLMSAKFSLIANAYQMAYFKDMPWPMDDGFPLYRLMSGKNWLEVNPANTYPWPLATKNGKPTVVSAEMAVVYRFHEFIINSFPIKDGLNETIWDQGLFETAFNATGFIDAGLENILRGVVSTFIPNFKSGVDEDFRSAGRYRGRPFDIVVSSIVHEREQGLPPFNEYFRAYNKAGPEVHVPIREKFEDFSSDPEMVRELKKLYKSPDDVDLVVGCQLDEIMFPHATIPTSSLIISLFSLISMGNSDRFSVGFAAMRCLMVDKPWDCHPSNALEELLWKPAPKDGFPNFRIYDSFWMTELDFQAHGQNLLWRLITENSEIKCLQKNPLFPVNEETNPILCSAPKADVDIKLIAATGMEVTVSLFKRNFFRIMATMVALAVTVFFSKKLRAKVKGYPDVLRGMPVFGNAQAFQRDSKGIIVEGIKNCRSTKSQVFGMRLASMTHYFISQPEDIQMMIDDAPYEMKFSLRKFFEAINMPIILRKDNFDTDLHANLIRTHLGNPKTIQELGRTIDLAAKEFLSDNPIVPNCAASKRYEALSSYVDRYIAGVCARVMVGADADDHPELIDMLLQFNVDVDKTIGMGIVLPSFLRIISKLPISLSYYKFRRIFIPIIERRRKDLKTGQEGFLDFMPFILEVVEDNKRASDLVAITIWIGLRGLQITLTSTLLDIIDVPGLSSEVASSLLNASVKDLDIFKSETGAQSAWGLLRSAMFESIRLCGPATGPARIISAEKGVSLASDPSVRLPPQQVATLSSFYSHRLPINWGPDAAEYNAKRFIERGPDVGSASFITWGLKGPHTCPGRWFAQETICIMVKALLSEYHFVAEKTGLKDDEKYAYNAGVVTRKEVPVMVFKRS